MLGRSVETRKYVDYQRIRDGFVTGKIALHADTESYVVHLLLTDAISTLQFEEAQVILDAYRARLATHQTIHLEQHLPLLTKQALLLGKWCEYLVEQGERQKARELREQTIALYRLRVALCSPVEGETPIQRDHRNYALGYYLSHLAYHLWRADQNEEALEVVDQAIALQEQGYAYTGVLAASYNDKSQILIALGRFRVALLFDEKALTEIQRYASAGDGISQEEIPIYSVNRGRLYLRLGRVDEAKQILEYALPRISEQRRIYRMFAREALEEIKQWRQTAVASEHQLDWRWVGRFRQLVALSSSWWLTWAGPFTAEEQQAWTRLFVFPLDEATKAELGMLMKISRERELEAAIVEQREPRLQYPAIPIEEVRSEIDGLLQLDEDVRLHEPNAIVRRLYQGAIEEELDYLRLLEATYEGNVKRFWECSLRIFPLPSVDDMKYAFTRIKPLLRRGLTLPELAAISQQLEEMLRTRFYFSYDLGQDETENQETPLTSPDNITKIEAEPARKISVQTAKRFFEAVLHESGYDEWQVVIDLNVTGARVSQGARQITLPEQEFTLTEIQHLLSHELAGHTARFMAGEHSLLGLLGIHTRNYLPTEEGLVLYHQCQEELRQGRRFNDEGVRWTTFALGLASGVMTPPQTFLSLFTFLEALTLLHGRLNWPKREWEKTRSYARTYALSICLRIFRGVPDLNLAGICFLQDATYLRGLRLIEQAVSEDETVLERLAVGACALENLPDLYELGIVTPPPSLRKLTTASDLDAYILSFEGTPEEKQDT